MGPNGSIWLLLGINGLWCPKLVGKGGTRLEKGMGHWDWLHWPLYQSINTQIWTLGGPKMGVNGSKRLLWSLNGLWFPKLVGKAWTDIVTRYGALGLTTLTTLTIHKYPNWDPRVSQNGFKWVYMGSNSLWCPKHGWNKMEQGWNRVWGIGTDHSDHFRNT